MFAMSDPSLTSTLLRVVIVFVLLFATMRVMARLTGSRRAGRGRARGKGRAAPRRRHTAARPIELVDRQAINRNATIAIVEVDGRRIAVGITEQNVRLLVDLSTSRGEDATTEIDLRDTPDNGGGEAPSLRALADTLRADARRDRPVR
jgi:hypothetical protein